MAGGRQQAPSYAEHDLGLLHKYTDAARERKETEEQYRRVKARLAGLESEEAKTRMRLQRAVVHARAQEGRRKVQQLREQDGRRRAEIEQHQKREKELLRNQERDRKERAREKLEGLYMSKRNEVDKLRNGWAKEKEKHEANTSQSLVELQAWAREARETSSQRRRQRKDDEELKLQRICEQRVRERFATEKMLKERVRQEEAERVALAREIRDRQRDFSTRQFDERVRARKKAVAADIQHRVDARKVHCADMRDEMESLERREAAVRRRLDEAKALLAENDPGGLASPMAMATPRLLRSR
eukprot:TRINITY_DN1410_c0_g1_i1.p1 TRINITY_DN1410_c0_g1~~TRINITY_DN1410_c0_g1_i1.p1  ORF type:complete len:316 (+),score=108.35 TRINITY_DN1410_c0_g1_i1:48-950(+)